MIPSPPLRPCSGHACHVRATHGLKKRCARPCEVARPHKGVRGRQRGREGATGRPGEGSSNEGLARGGEGLQPSSSTQARRPVQGEGARGRAATAPLPWTEARPGCAPGSRCAG